ncbi:MAG: hypothetical protein MH132_05335 [Hydrotalea sp.]|nr:hypothetical protein [Hydrotalea sp.]
MSLAIIIGVGCKKQELELVHQNQELKVDPSKIQYQPQTATEKKLVENLGKLSDIIKKLYLNKANLDVVNAAIFAKSYTDESILIKDLIYPETSILKSNKRFTQAVGNPSNVLNNFASAFWAEVITRGDSEFNNFLSSLRPVPNNSITLNDINSSNGGNEVSIYFPFHEDYINTPPSVVSIISATADSDEGIGEIPNFNSSGQFVGFTQVLINDDYVAMNPTHIIGLNGVEPWDDGGNIPLNLYWPSNPIDIPGLTREVKQVHIGSVKIHGKQYDRLISFTGNGGGSDIVFTRSDGFLKVLDGQVQADNFFTPVKTVSRKSIRQRKWVDFSYEWDGDWEVNNHRQVFAIFEEDTRNHSEISGKISTTLKLSDMVTTTVDLISWKISFKSDDPIIKQTEMKRESFFALNRTNHTGEMYQGWPVIDKTGPVSYTLNDRTYY